MPQQHNCFVMAIAAQGGGRLGEGLPGNERPPTKIKIHPSLNQVCRELNTFVTSPVIIGYRVLEKTRFLT